MTKGLMCWTKYNCWKNVRNIKLLTPVCYMNVVPTAVPHVSCIQTAHKPKPVRNNAVNKQIQSASVHSRCYFKSHSRKWITKQQPISSITPRCRGQSSTSMKAETHHRPCRRESSYFRSPAINFALSHHISLRYSVMLTDRHHVILSSRLLHEACSVLT
jgi:hypothetical protein